MTHRFLITGGAGFLGINLIRFLLQRGHTVTSLDLAEFRYRDVVDRVQAIQGDVRDPGVVDRALEGVDIVVHAAAALPLYPRQEIYTTNIDGTRAVLEATYRRGIRRLIHISSTAVYGIPDHHPLLEDDLLSGVGPYGETKVRAEAVCHEYRRQGLCLPILRPKSFVGPERLGATRPGSGGVAQAHARGKSRRGRPAAGSAPAPGAVGSDPGGAGPADLRSAGRRARRAGMGSPL